MAWLSQSQLSIENVIGFIEMGTYLEHISSVFDGKSGVTEDDNL
jgi:hypothetical protein